MRLSLSDNGTFLLNLPASERKLVGKLMREEGLDYSNKLSTSSNAILMTKEPYAAVGFWDQATPKAQAALADIRREIEASWAKQSNFTFPVPDGEEVWPYEAAGVEYIVQRQHSLLADVPGLGKTMQSISACNVWEAKRVLVVCPANIRIQWLRMIRRWSLLDRPTIYPVLNSRNGVHPSADWTVISYDLARSKPIYEALLAQRFDVAIFDECHYLKTPDAQRTRNVLGSWDGKIEGLLSRCEHGIGLSGTPIPNRPREAYTLGRAMCWDAFDWMSEQTFTDRFNPSRVADNGYGVAYVDERTGRHGELQARLRANLMVRREKHGVHGVMDQLKLPAFDIVHVEPDQPIKHALQAERLLDIDPDHLPGPDSPIFGQISTVRRMMGEAMAPHVAEYVSMCLDGGEPKLVVFAHHISVLDTLEEALAKYGVVRIDGRTGPVRKTALVDRFCADPSIRVCMGNLMSLGTGTDGLQDVASHAIFAEADWTPGNNQQCVDRLHRAGQKDVVQADFIVAPGSLSERVLGTALRKLGVIHSALDKGWLAD